MKNKPRVLFLSHGGGPLPLLGDDGHTEMVECLRKIAIKIERPSAIILVSAHWEEAIPTITSGTNPSLIYDYYGFPEEAYSIQYPCPGEPSLAKNVCQLLDNAGIKSNLDDQRGFDHGLFVPLKIMYPNADIPCVQLSLVKGLDPAVHIKIGQALQSLNDENLNDESLNNENLLFIGSGFSFHNMKAFFAPETNESIAMNAAFEAWLLETCSDPNMTERDRTQKLVHWANAPSARYCHPREEHLLPLHVCYGIANTSCSEAFELKILDKKSSMYLW